MLSFKEYCVLTESKTWDTTFNLEGEKAVDYTQFSNQVVKKIFDTTLSQFAVSTTDKPITVSELNIPFKNDDRLFIDRIKKTVKLDRLQKEGLAKSPITVEVDIKRNSDYAVLAKFTAIDEIDMRKSHGHASFAYTQSMEEWEFVYKFRHYPFGTKFVGPKNGTVKYESKIMLKRKDRHTAIRKVVTTINVSVTNIMADRAKERQQQ